MLPHGPSSTLLVVSLGQAVTGIDVASGVIVWAFQAAWKVERLFKVGPRLMLVAGSRVWCLDHDTGQLIGDLDLGFQVEAGIVCGTDLVLAQGGLAGLESACVVCLTSEGAVRWRVESKTRSTGLLSGDTVLRTVGAAGDLRSQHVFEGLMSGNAGLALGDVTVQPDRTGS